MPDHYNGTHSAGQRAQQQLRNLGSVTRQTTRLLNHSSPNAAEGSRILRQYEQLVAQTLQPPPPPQKTLPQAPKKKWSWFPWKRKRKPKAPSGFNGYGFWWG
jgi:hypothetical protein